MVCQATGHRRGTGPSPVFGFAQFLMGTIEIVRATNQIHPRVQRLDARSRVPTLACEARQPLTESPIQAFNKSRIEHVPSMRDLEQLLRLLKQALSHFADNLYDPLFLCSLDHCPDVQLRPHL